MIAPGDRFDLRNGAWDDHEDGYLADSIHEWELAGPRRFPDDLYATRKAPMIDLAGLRMP